MARLLELDKLASQQVLYMPSRNRQWHMYACSDKDARAPALKRLFLRGQVRAGEGAGGPRRGGGVSCLVAHPGGGPRRAWAHPCGGPTRVLPVGRAMSQLALPPPGTPTPQVRQLGHPALLAAQYSGNTSAVAVAAVNELEEALANCLEELTRPAPDHGAAGKADWVHLYFRYGFN